MTEVFSGGLVYEYTMESNNYGIVKIDGPKDVTTLDDFDRLKAEFKKTPNPDNDGGYKSDGKPSKCPASSNLWAASDNIPSMPDSASKYLETGAGEPRGTDGPSNQYIPTDESAPSDTGAASSPTTTSGKDGQVSSPVLKTSIPTPIPSKNRTTVVNTPTSSDSNPSGSGSPGIGQAALRDGAGVKMCVAATVVVASFVAGMML